MAKAKKPTTSNEKFNTSLNKTLALLKGILIAIGRPFFLIITYSLVSIFVFGSLLKETKFPAIKIRKITFPKFSLPSLKLPKIKVRLPRFIFRGLLVLSLLILISIPIVVIMRNIFSDLPSPNQLLTRNIEVSTKIYDRNGILLYKFYKNKNRTLVSINNIPLSVRLATLAAEDAEFYNHPGFSLRGIFRALRQNIQKGTLTGGSTITQQLVKNTLLSSEKTIIRKLKEIVLSIRVELTFSKDQILEMYLNDISYGGSAYGIQEAAQLYFAKDVSQLNLAEAALLAGLPKSPTKFSPFGNSPDLALSRQKEVLKLMLINSFISDQQKEEAENEKITFAQNKTNIKAPHFVMYVRDILEDKYGTDLVEKGGLNVITTLDYSMQKMAEEVVKNQIEKLQSLHVTNAAVVVLDSQTSEILAMVGSKDYFDQKESGQVNVTIRNRQPGSSIKIINYAYALAHGYTPATYISDSPVTFSVTGQKPYTPKNYDSEYRGLIPLRSALAESRNIPAVKVLASYGVQHMIEMGQKMGVTTWNNPSRYGLSLTLGGGEIKLLDLTSAYATLAKYGRRVAPTPIISIRNYKSELIEENSCSQSFLNFESKENSLDKCGEQVLDPRVAYQLIDILKDNKARSPSFGSYSRLVVDKHPEIAVKTGTSNDLRDNLTLGFNQKFAVGVWVGNNDNSPMSKIASGVTGAAPIWNEIISRLVSDETSVGWTVPHGLVQIPCQGRTEFFLEENIDRKSCTKVSPQILEPAAATENLGN